MSTHRSTRPSASLATTASALVALVAMAAVMSSLPGSSVRAAVLDSRVAPVEAPTVRAVAAAVAAAARELVGGQHIAAAMRNDHFLDALIAASPMPCGGDNESRLLHSRPIAERLIDLPPPVC